MRFLIGPDEDPFDLPAEIIDPGTYLDRYINFPGEKKTRISKSGEIEYLLREESSDLFGEFASFLLGGDFLWNEEIAEYFSYMGYTNEQGYPLAYWKIKLIDNWIRNNFYRLELWNEDTTLAPLLIERGPYVGLVDVTDTFSSNYVTTQRTPVDELRKITDRIGIGSPERPNAIIAGGAIITFLTQYYRLPPDIDIFITTKDTKVGDAIVERLVTDQVRFEYVNHPALLVGPVVYKNAVRTANAITIGTKPKMQVILRTYTCPSEVVHGFDLDASGLLYNGERVWATKRAAYALEKMTNFFDPDRMSPSYGHRLAKYVTKGFKVWLPGFDQSKVDWGKLGEIAENAGSDYDRYHNDNWWEHAPRWLPPDRDLFESLKGAAASLLMNANPIDLILFATYFRYIPNTISDYEKGKSEKKKPLIIIKPSIVLGVGVGDEESKDRYYAAPGYVKVIADDNISDILDLTPEIARASGLPPRIQWKELDPMSQLTGTFQPSKTALRDWYQGSTLYEY